MIRKKPNPDYPLTGKKQSPEHIKARVEARKQNGNYKVSQEQRDAIAKTSKGRKPWNTDKKLSEDHKKNLSESHKGLTPWNKGIESGQVCWNKGKTKETDPRLKKISEKLQGRVMDDEWRANMSKSWDYSKHVTEESRAKQRKSRSKQIFPKHDTGIEKMMQKALTDQGINWEKQKLFENDQYYHRVDLFIEPNICIECDGDFWHRSKPDVVMRDRMSNDILPEMGQIVVRVRGSDIRRDPNKCAMAIQQIMVKENGAHKKGV